MLKFSIKAKSADNIIDSVILEEGLTNEFTLREAEYNKAEKEKLVKELKGQLKLSDATIGNIEEHHPFVKDLSEQQLLTVHMYVEAKSKSKILPQKIEEIKGALGRYKEKLEQMLGELPELKEVINGLISTPVSPVALEGEPTPLPKEDNQA